MPRFRTFTEFDGEIDNAYDVPTHYEAVELVRDSVQTALLNNVSLDALLEQINDNGTFNTLARIKVQKG